jgi:Uncharacterised nucleotidyltransferase
MAGVALLDALRAVTSFSPPPALPECDFGLLADVLVAHGLAPLASYQLEHTRLGAGAPGPLRERLLAQYQGVANDNVLRLVTLRGLLRDAPDVPAVVLDAAAYVDWLYPHMAFRPVGDLRLAVRAADGARFAEAVRATMQVARTEHDGRVLVLSDGRLTVSLQEGHWPGAAADALLFERRVPYRAFGPSAARPSPEDALLATVAEQALLGLQAPLVTTVDLRELVLLRPDARYVRERAEALRLSRALHGALALVSHFYPEVADAAAPLAPALGRAERAAVDRVVEAARDPARLRRLRGVDAAPRLVVAP